MIIDTIPNIFLFFFLSLFPLKKIAGLDVSIFPASSKGSNGLRNSQQLSDLSPLINPGSSRLATQQMPPGLTALERMRFTRDTPAPSKLINVIAVSQLSALPSASLQP
ncbi:MAG: hypothetical protein Q8P67_25660, partial [archaeon]|nr:hypothetical protein [archaeon]